MCPYSQFACLGTEYVARGGRVSVKRAFRLGRILNTVLPFATAPSRPPLKPKPRILGLFFSTYARGYSSAPPPFPFDTPCYIRLCSLCRCDFIIDSQINLVFIHSFKRKSINGVKLSSEKLAYMNPGLRYRRPAPQAKPTALFPVCHFLH